jgi:hypothetical protein
MSREGGRLRVRRRLVSHQRWISKRWCARSRPPAQAGVLSGRLPHSLLTRSLGDDLEHLFGVVGEVDQLQVVG